MLELEPLAGRSEIIDALARLRSIYGAASDASYSLFSNDDRQRILTELDLAEYHLLDTDRRARYDREILKIGGTRHELPPPLSQEPVINSQAADTAPQRQPIGFRPPEVVSGTIPLQAISQPAAPAVIREPLLSRVVPSATGTELRRAPVPAVAGPVRPATAAPVMPNALPQPSGSKPIPISVAHDRPRPDPAGYFQEKCDYTGKNLRRYRDASGFTIREISAITRVSPQHIENIELDDYSHLPAAVYLKGFLKSYCKVLGLNVQTVVNGYMEHVRIYYELHKQ